MRHKTLFKHSMISLLMMACLLGATAYGADFDRIQDDIYLDEVSDIQADTNIAKPNVLQTPDNLKKYQALARQKNLANHKVWRRLFYVGHEHSRVEYDKFFLHPQGKTDLSAELATTLEQMLTDISENSPQCRFPARTAWLIKELGIRTDELASVNCAKFNDWYTKINPHSMTLIFASDYMGSPGSMFGHTLLRIDPIKQAGKNMDLVAYALNYAAITPTHENGMVYAYKGLTGKYGGEYSLMRYFHKTKEYGDLESRDMWEHELNLTPDEVAFLVKHIWEMQHVRFPYYFMDENCSYALMGLIDLVRPQLDLQEKFSWTVVPIETVKAMDKAGLIGQTHYRPSLETRLKYQEVQHGTNFGKTAHRLTLPSVVPSELLKAYDAPYQAQLLEMAHDDLYLQQTTKKTDPAFAKTRLRELLVLRSAINVPQSAKVPQSTKEVARPYDPRFGHGDKAWQIGVGQMQGQTVSSVGYRVAYHGFFDPHAGYTAGQLLFLNGALLVREDKVKLDYLDILSVHAVNPITTYKRPYSWGVDLGFKQVATDDKGNFSPSQTHGVALMSSEVGYAKSFFKDKMVCGAYVGGEVQAGKALDKGVRAGAFPKMRCLWHYSDNIQGALTLKAPFWQDKHHWQTQTSASIQYNLSPQHTLRLTAEHERQGKEGWHKLMLGYQRYY